MQLLLVDDHPMIRVALRALLAGRDPPIEVVGEASSAGEAVAMAEALEPDLVIMDLLMPGPSGVAATREILRVRPACRVLVYTALEEPAFAMDAFAAGAHGYAIKTDGVEELLTALAQVGRGDRYVAPAIARQLPALGTGTRDAGVGLTGLSRREREIFDLIVKGRSTADVAAQLFISVKTVETHRSRINRKLGVHSTAQLIRFAALNGLVYM